MSVKLNAGGSKDLISDTALTGPGGPGFNYELYIVLKIKCSESSILRIGKLLLLG